MDGCFCVHIKMIGCGNFKPGGRAVVFIFLSLKRKNENKIG